MSRHGKLHHAIVNEALTAGSAGGRPVPFPACRKAQRMIATRGNRISEMVRRPECGRVATHSTTHVDGLDASGRGDCAPGQANENRADHSWLLRLRRGDVATTVSIHTGGNLLRTHYPSYMTDVIRQA